MKVMLICPRYGPPWNEGSKNIVRVLAEGLPNHGIEVVIYSEKDVFQTKHFSSKNNLSVLVKKPLFWWKASKEARIQKVGLIHLLSSASAILGLKSFVIRRLSGIPLLLHVTGLESPLHGYKWLLTADLIAVGGHYLKKFFPNSLDLPPVSPHMNPECGNQSWQSRLSEKPRKILYLGAMEPVRGVHTLIDALATLIRHFGMKDVTATIAWNGYGDRTYLSHVEEKVEDHQIQQHVVWEQTIADLPAFYKTHDVIVIPRASQERMAFPLRLIEAMSYGKPVVVSDLGEMPRIIGKCGLVFPHEDAGSLAEALRRLLSDRSLYNQCAENCYQKAEEYHSSRTIRRLSDLYGEIALGG